MANDWMYHVKSNTLQKRLFADLENGIFTDVLFTVGLNETQRAFKAHRLVMAAENYEFEKILHRSVSGEIAIPDVHPKGFENLIRYCYGESFCSLGDLSAIRETYLAAEKFKVPELKLAVENHLIELVKSETVIEILQLSMELKMPPLKERCLEIISSQFEKALMTERLVSTPLEVIEVILSLCPDHGLEFKIYSLVTLLRWAKKHKCPEDITLRLLSMVQDEHIAYDDIFSFFKTKIEQLNQNQLREVIKDFVSKEFQSLEFTSSIESADTVENAAAVSPKGIITKDNASELKGEKERDTGDDSNDDGLVMENIMKELTNHTSILIKNFVSSSSEKTEVRMTKTVNEVINHASETMQEAIDVMIDSFSYLYAATSTEQKDEITTADVTEPSSFKVGNENERIIKDM